MHALKNKVALVTGGGSGLGAAVSRTLAGAGSRVLVADVREDAAQQTAAAVRDMGGEAYGVHLDVADAEQVEQAVRDAVQQHGSLDILINSAGIDLTVPIEEMGVFEWDRIIGVNLRGPFLTAKQAFPVMARQGGGHIVNIVSTAALRAWGNASAYHASKSGLLGLSNALHVEGRAHGIRVTAVISGGMRTPFLLDRFPDIDPDVLQEPGNVAETVRFVLTQPPGTVIPQVMVLPVNESSWP
ncbi:MAG: SDR family oxidoreductase [Dehalococcoidia bacterium]